MKNLFLMLILAFIAGSCSVTKTSKRCIYQVTVSDKNTSRPVDSARVILTELVDSRDVYEYASYTDIRGRCTFSHDCNSLAQYQVRAMKKGFTGYLDATYPDLDRAVSFINGKTGSNIDLWLTSDTLNHRNFWLLHAAKFDIDTLINLLESNRYTLRSEIPLLAWEDIPKLLAIGNNKSLINKYPISPVSSGYAKDCFTGIVALWFIESARITGEKRSPAPSDRFPSLTPTLWHKSDPEMESNTIEIMEQAYQAYFNWWNKVKKLDKDSGSKTDPFAGTDLEWR